MLEVNNDFLNEVLVIRLSGRLDGITSKTFTEKTNASEYASSPHVVIDCSDLNYISSEGLRVMLMAAKKAKSLGGALTLASVNSSVNEVMVISGFGALLGVHANAEDAIKAIKP
jgi:anti-sigma B factor antagonist